MSSAFEQTYSTTVEMCVSITPTGINVACYRDQDLNPYIQGIIDIESIIDTEIEHLCIINDQSDRNIIPASYNLKTHGRRLTEGSVASLLEYRDMLLRGIERIDQYIVEIGDE